MKMIESNGICDCAVCKNNHRFNMPDEIIEAAKKEELIIFCGAGISTESKNVLPTSFYMEILNELKYQFKLEVNVKTSFPDLMSKFIETVPNGRRELIRRIKSRFDQIETFPKLYFSATRFHKEIASNPLIDTIITTNWDDYFERECAASPIIDNKDVALWNTFERRIFKIHGSINNIGSIVATSEDYEKCYDRLKNQAIGDRLKTLLSSHTVVFIGFSFGDDDLNKIIDILSEDLQEFANQYYLVTIDKSWEEKNDSGIIPIITDGVFFIHSLNNILINSGLLFSNTLYDYASDLRKFVEEFHVDWFETNNFRKNLSEFPELLLSIAYQDGFIHALERCLADKKYGSFLRTDYLPPYLRSYDYMYKKRLEEKNYDMAFYDLGYFDGLVSLSLFLNEEIEALPGLFVYGEENFDDIDNIIESIKINRDEDVFSFCHNKVSKFPEKIVPEYKPWFC